MTESNPSGRSIVNLSTKTSVESFLSSISCIIFDCDGVLYAGSSFFPHTIECLTHLSQNLGKKLYFLTNNSTKSRVEYKKKFLSMGFESLDAIVEDVFCSAYAASIFLEDRVKSIEWANDERERGIFVVGMSGIKEELENVGIKTFGYEFSTRSYSEDEILETFEEYKRRYDIKCVIVGYDKNWNMFKCAFAALCLQEIPGCIYVVTNEDTSLPWRGSFLPGNGTIIEQINKATNRRPDVVCGKPNTLLLDHLVEKYELERKSVLMVGDRLETDIRMANDAKISSLAVISGVASLEDVTNAVDEERPDFVVKSLNDMFLMLKE